MIVVNGYGRAFYVRIVQRGDRYGLDDCKVHRDADALIEFYDHTFANRDGFGARGQFVSRYYATTLAKHEDGMALNLHGGTPAWYIDEEPLRPVVAMARKLAKEIP